MSLEFQPVEGYEDHESLVSVVLNGKIVGFVWREKASVYTTLGHLKDRLNNRWFARLINTPEEEDDIGKGMARSGNRKGDGFFNRHDAVRALLDARQEALQNKMMN